MWRPVPFLLLGVLLLGAGAGVGLGLSEAPGVQTVPHGPPHPGASGAPATPTPTAATTPSTVGVASFWIEPPCGGIVRSPLLRPTVDLRPQLLRASDLPAGASGVGPDETSTTGPTTWASVPTITPAADASFTLSEDTATGGTAALAVEEVIGDVGSPSLATELLSTLDADLDVPACNPNGADVVALPGSNPPVEVTISGGQTSAGDIHTARLFAARGAELLCLTWTSSTALNGTAGAQPTLAPLPDLAEMSSLLEAALGHLAA